MSRVATDATVGWHRDDSHDQFEQHRQDVVSASKFGGDSSPSRPSPIRIHLQILGFGSGKSHPRSDPSKAGTEHPGGFIRSLRWGKPDDRAESRRVPDGGRRTLDAEHRTPDTGHRTPDTGGLPEMGVVDKGRRRSGFGEGNARRSRGLFRASARPSLRPPRAPRRSGIALLMIGACPPNPRLRTSDTPRRTEWCPED